MTSGTPPTANATPGTRCGHAFDECDRRAFIARGDGDQIARCIDRGDVSLPAEKPNAGFEAKPRDLRAKYWLHFATARDQERGAGIGAGDPRGRIEKHIGLLDCA